MKNKLSVLLACAALFGCSTTPKPFSPMPIPARRTAPPPAAAASAPTTKSVTLAWDYPPGMASLSGFVVYYGNKPGIYTNQVQAFLQTTVTISGLFPKSVYYFACKAIGTNGEPSEFSNEVKYTVPGKRVKLVIQEVPSLTGPQLWSNVATNYHETEAVSGFYRVIISTDEL